jgi:hypothetical protein
MNMCQRVVQYARLIIIVSHCNIRMNAEKEEHRYGMQSAKPSQGSTLDSDNRRRCCIVRTLPIASLGSTWAYQTLSS